MWPPPPAPPPSPNSLQPWEWGQPDDQFHIFLKAPIPWRREWLLTLVFLPGEFHGQRSLAGYSPWGHKESDTTKWLILSHFSLKSLSQVLLTNPCVILHSRDTFLKKVPNPDEPYLPARLKKIFLKVSFSVFKIPRLWGVIFKIFISWEHAMKILLYQRWLLKKYYSFGCTGS